MMKKFSQKTLWTLILLAVLLLFALVNLCAGAADQRYPLSLDLTESRLYELSDETRATLAGLPPTTVHVFAAEADFPAMFREILAHYRKLAPSLTLAYTDPAENPLLLSSYRQLGLTVGASDIVVEGTTRSRAIAYQDLLVYQDGQPTGTDLEQRLTSALRYCNSTNTARVLFLTGHGESPGEALRSLFTANAYEVADAAPGIDPLAGAAIVVLAGPAHDYTAEETAALEEYLRSGGSLLALLGPTVNPLPNLTALLADWGLTPLDQIVFEPRAYASGSPHYVIPMYAAADFNVPLAEQGTYPVLPSCRAIRLGDGAPGAEVAELLRSTTDSYAKEDLAFTSTARADADPSGPFTLAALAERAFDGGTGRVLLIGSSLMAADDLLRMSTYANRLFLTQSIGALYAEGETLSIPPKLLGLSPIAITRAQSLWLALLLAVAMPVAVLLVGGAVFLRRRRL